MEKKLARKKVVASRRMLQEAGASVLLFAILSSLELCLLHSRCSINICSMNESPSHLPFQNADSLVQCLPETKINFPTFFFFWSNILARLRGWPLLSQLPRAYPRMTRRRKMPESRPKKTKTQ